MFRNTLLLKFTLSLKSRFAVAGLALLLVATATPGVSQAADSWVFGRSYYSHNPVEPVQVGRRSAGGPFYSRPQGEYVRTGFRQTRSSFNLPFGSGSGDRIIMNESWIQYGVQF